MRGSAMTQKEQLKGILRIDRTGQKVGIMTVESYSHFEDSHHYWNLRCECGTIKKKHGSALSNSKLKSCGCLTKNILSKARTIHGQSHCESGKPTKTYSAWCSMKLRCTLKTRKDWLRYGGRGISICDRWASFDNFLQDMGVASSGMSLDRIDCNGNYEPDNCRWATAKEQANNRTSNTLITFKGVTKTLCQWADEIGVARDTLSLRIKSGMDLARAMTNGRLSPLIAKVGA
jgi:hypothetical protein